MSFPKTFYTVHDRENFKIRWAPPPSKIFNMVSGGYYFAGPMRATRSLTMLDPFQKHYGKYSAIFLFMPALCGEIFWTAAILNALGKQKSQITSTLDHANVDSQLVDVLQVHWWCGKACDARLHNVSRHISGFNNFCLYSSTCAFNSALV